MELAPQVQTDRQMGMGEGRNDRKKQNTVDHSTHGKLQQKETALPGTDPRNVCSLNCDHALKINRKLTHRDRNYRLSMTHKFTAYATNTFDFWDSIENSVENF